MQKEAELHAAKLLTLGFVGCGTGEVWPFDQVFDNGLRVDAKMIEEGAPIDSLIIWGGEDISPKIYNETASRFVGHYYNELSARDHLEVAACKAAMARDIPIIGVCRGAQLLCALAGGRLIQHVENHGRDHYIDTFDHKHIITSSCHHQMMFPFGVDHKMIAWSSKRVSDVYVNQHNLNDPEMEGQVEPEICWFPKIKGLAIQGHPEFMDEKDPFVQYCMDLTHMYILNEGE